MMEDSIRNFPQQFLYDPIVEIGSGLKSFPSAIVVVGMGGSHLAAGILRMVRPELAITIHRDYGLPLMPPALLSEGLVVLNSYSGNTEEVLDAAELAHDRKLPLIIITTGGKLWEFASDRNVPRVQLPTADIQPRMALGYMLRALMKVIGDESGLAETKTLATTLDARQAEVRGKKLAEAINGKVPIIYASRRNHALAHAWKIKFNETGKIPAFFNVFPELNHNEMMGFDVRDVTRSLSEKFCFIFLTDPGDDQRIERRAALTKELLTQRGLSVEVVPLERQSNWENIFQSLLIADWATYYLAAGYGVELEHVPMVEELKRRMAEPS